jgi:hypothetical protein
MCHDRRFQGRDSNSIPPEYEAEVLTTRPRRSVEAVNIPEFKTAFY